MARRGPGRVPTGESDGRQDLLVAGLPVFAERGYAAARTRNILAAANTTAPTLYHHFGSKAGLYLAVVDDVNSRIIAAFTTSIAGRTGFLERVDGLLDATTGFQAQDRAAASLVLAAPVEIRRHPELAAGRSSTRRLLEFVEQTCRTASGLAVEPDVATQAVMTIINGLARPAASLEPAQFAEVVTAVRVMTRGGLVRPR